ncbi:MULTISPECIES: hypothetical protein [unclassified Moorena]|uniref:hypothetical protein n=1 Tax=unclassified Moorena TaxID=2683338 RepID=UPI0013FF1D62|nr:MULTISPECIES: hypothetical protein [unclassified Moorena]NEO15854.1 hypothetical protein [Moorena sp. SIO3E8]NEQ02251.1 hypothetical protein [Moorena sp. SIO3F7]
MRYAHATQTAYVLRTRYANSLYATSQRRSHSVAIRVAWPKAKAKACATLREWLTADS